MPGSQKNQPSAARRKLAGFGKSDKFIIHRIKPGAMPAWRGLARKDR
jgi:hypothetical protein